MTIAGDTSLFIYIPIWIDLKAARSTPPILFKFNLHSNMDRFESCRINGFIMLVFDLHSNMDRFESVACLSSVGRKA